MTTPATLAFRRDYADGDPGEDPWNRISWFNSHARNKRDVTMDITRPEGRELFLRLVERSDGFVENNAPGLLERLDIGPDVLLARNPRLIIVRMPPLGLSGPDVTATGFGWHFEELERPPVRCRATPTARRSGPSSWTAPRDRPGPTPS